MQKRQRKLEWDDKYSVGVQQIDNQHKQMFETINLLIETVSATPTQDKVKEIIDRLIEYKKFHFVTEEKYFEQFHYEKTDEHKEKHQYFNKRLTEIQEQHKDDVLVLAFELIDFLENWLVEHLMTADQDYKQCFKEHGLK